jgi:hypothetical protein
MKCIACGREMIDRGKQWECSNVLCDYEEEIDTPEVFRRGQQILDLIFLYCEPINKFSFVDA